MTPVPRSTDTHNHHNHHHHHHHHRLMNIQPIQKASITSRQLSGDSAITNSDNYCGGPSSNGPKEGQLLGDSKDLEKGPSNNFSSSTTSLSSSRKTPFTTTSDVPAAQDPVEGSLIISSKNTDAAVATPKAKQYNDTHVINKHVASTASSVAVPIVSTQPSPAANSKLDLIEKYSSFASADLSISGGNNKKYNGVVATEAWTSPIHLSSIVTPPFSSGGIAGGDALNVYYNVGIDSASQSQTISSTNMVHGIGKGSLDLADTRTAGIKRKMSPTIATMNSSPAGGSSLPLLRRTDIAMELRNKRMKATDCLIFAATLLEDESLMTARINTALPFTTEPSANVLSCTTNPPPTTKTKPMKKMVCEKVERDLQEAAQQQQHQQQQQELQRQQQQQQQQQQEQRQQQTQEEDRDAENKPKEADVLCGRGGKVNKHAGNIVYRKVVEYNKSYYQSVHKKHRILVSQSIVKAIINYGGRFMGRKGKEWSPICFKKAVQKTSQALRERSNKSDVLPGEQRLIGAAEIVKK